MRKVAFTLILALAAQLCAAVPRFRTPLLQRIAKSTALTLPDTMEPMADNDSTWKFRGRQLRIRTNSLGDVCHIGYKLFNNEIVALHGNRALFDFLERYFLELDLQLDGKTFEQRLNVDRVVIKEGSRALMGQVTADVAFSVNYTPRRAYSIGWRIGNKPLTLTFPTDVQLMQGANAIELEDIVTRDVPRQSSETDLLEALAPWAKGHEVRLGDVRLKDYGTYLSRLIGSRIKLKLHNSQWLPEISPSSPTSSICTMMLTGCSRQPIPLHLVVDRYGYKQESIDVSLQQLLTFFRAEDSRVYVGFKNRTDTAVEGTLFVLNEAMGFNHVVPFTFPISLLSGGTGRIEAKIYAYIPLQNVTEKFFESDNYKDPDYEK